METPKPNSAFAEFGLFAKSPGKTRIVASFATVVKS